MSIFTGSYVVRVLLAQVQPSCGLNAVNKRWRWLKNALFDSYRPELHYMRGPGPKWREKHAPTRRL
jgi:hypothetical protein